MLRSALLLSPVLVAVGCSCNQEYSFPPLQQQTFEAPVDYGSWLSMSTAPDGTRLTMTYYDRDQTGIGFAVGTPQVDGTIEWLHERVDGYPEDDGLDRGDRGKYSTHVITADGTVHAAYQDSQNGTLRAAVREAPGVWTNDQVDVGTGILSTGAGAWASMALYKDSPIVAHHDEEAGTLRVSWLTEAGWESEEAWSGSGDVGKYANIAVFDDTVYIAFYDAINGNLDLIEGAPGSWTFSEVDITGDVGQWPSMQVDADGILIAYQDTGEQDLKLARRTGASWSFETIDTGEFRGADSHLFTLNSQPAIVYFDGQNNDMWLATTDGASWSLDKLGGDDGAVGFHNEVATIGGVVYAGSYDFSARTLFLTTIDAPAPPAE